MPAHMATAFEDPSILEKIDPPKPPRARMHCVDFLGLLGRYDDIDMLDFAIADTLPANQVAGQFPFKKTEDVDRLISNRRPRTKRRRWELPVNYFHTEVCFVRSSCYHFGGGVDLVMILKTCTTSFVLAKREH